jgi:hypothetical protein
VESANTGDPKAFAHVLDLAYGRKGKLRWEMMEVSGFLPGPFPDVLTISTTAALV